MKKFSKLLATILAVVITVSTVLSVPFSVVAQTDPVNLVPLWADTYAVLNGDGYSVSSGEKARQYDYGTTGAVSSTHYLIGGIGDRHTIRMRNYPDVFQTFADIQANGFKNVYDETDGEHSQCLPYATFYVIAPENGYYDFQVAYNGGNFENASGGHFMTYSVNDKYAVKGTARTAGGYYVDKIRLKFAKGMNFVRVLPLVKDFSTASPSIWCNIHAAWVDPRLEGVKKTDSTPKNINNLRTTSKYKAWPYKLGDKATDVSGGSLNGKVYDVSYMSETNVSSWAPSSTDYQSLSTSVFSENVTYSEYGTTEVRGTASTKYPRFSRTIYAPMDGYYDIRMQAYGMSSSSTITLTFPLIVNGEVFLKTNKFTNSNADYTASVNHSVYLNAGKNVVTFFAPYGSFGGYCNISYLQISGLLTDSSPNNQLDPKNMTSQPKAPTFTGINSSETSTDSDYIYASDIANWSGVDVRSTTNPNDGYNELHRDTAYKRATTGFTTTGGVGGVNEIHRYVRDLQTLESIQTDGFLNKTRMPYVTYQLNVPTAGDYDIETIYSVSLIEPYSYENYFAVVSANDKQFEKAYFSHYATNCYHCKKEGGSFDGNGTNDLEHHHSQSTVRVHLEAGRNIVRIILAVGETAPMVSWANFEAIRLKGPSKVTALASPAVVVNPATQATLASYQTSNMTETDYEGYSVTDIVGAKKVSGHNIVSPSEYGLYDEIISIGDMGVFPNFSVRINAPANGYYDIDLMIDYAQKYYIGKHAVFIDGVMHEYYMQDTTNQLFENRANLSMYLTAGNHIITVTCPTEYEYMYGRKIWTDFGNMTLYGGLTYVSKPTTKEVIQQRVNVQCLEAEQFAFASNDIQDTAQPYTAASGQSVMGRNNWDRDHAQSYGTLSTYFDSSNMRYITFMVEAPANGTYEITPGYYLHYPTTDYYITVLVNGKDTYKQNFAFRENAIHRNYRCYNSASMNVNLVKGVNTITILQGVKGNNEVSHNGKPVSDCYFNFDYLDIDDGLVGIPVHRDDNFNYDSNQKVTVIKGGDTSKVYTTGYTSAANTGDKADKWTHNGNNLTNANSWIIQGNQYSGKYSTLYADKITLGNLATETTSNGTTTYAGIPYISFTVKADKPGYYDVVAHFRQDTAGMTFGTNDQPHYISAIVDGQAQMVGFEIDTSNGHDFTGSNFVDANTSAAKWYRSNRIEFCPYLTEGEHTIVLTAPCAPSYTPAGTTTYTNYYGLMNYGDIELFGGLTVVTPQNPKNDTLLTSASYRQNVLEQLSDLAAQTTDLTTGKKITAAIARVQALSLTGNLATDMAAINNAAKIDNYYDDLNDPEPEAFYNARGAASSAAIAIKNDYSYTNPQGNVTIFEDSDTVTNLIDTAIRVIQRTEYNEAGTYSYNDTTYDSYQEYFDAILAKLNTDVIAQKQTEFDAYKADKITATHNYINENYADDYSEQELAGIRDIVDKMFASTIYDTTQPVTVSAKQVDAIYLTVRDNIDQMIADYNDFEAYRILCRDTYAPQKKVTSGDDPLTAATETNYVDPYSVDVAIGDTQTEINAYVYDFGLDLDPSKTTLEENKAKLDEMLANLETTANTYRTNRYYQSGTWVQYQVKNQVEATGQAYVRLFFEIDKDLNDYLDYGFYFSFKDDTYSIPTDPMKMSFKDLEIESIKAQTGSSASPSAEGDLEEIKYYYPYEYDRSGTSTHFVYVYFIIPVEMFGIDYYFQAYTVDKNGEYLGKMKTLDLNKKYGLS